MSETYEKARAIAEAAASHWDKFGDTQGVAWLADAIMDFGASPRDDGRCMCAACKAARADARSLCNCNIGRCTVLAEGCREIIAVCENDARDQDHNGEGSSWGAGSKSYAKGRGTACRGIAARLRTLLSAASSNQAGER